MFYVYIVKLPNEKLYIGYSGNLQQRIKTHQIAKNIKGLIYYEAYQSEKDARDREKQLKQYKSAYGYLKRRIKRSIENI